MPIDAFPPINASLNATAAVLLVLGYVAVRRGRIATHRGCMLAAFLVSCLFLAGYVTYHVLKAQQTGEGHTRFTGTGWVRPVYLFILASHVLLAIVNLPMTLVTLYLGLRGRFERHRRIARWTWPMWMYVSVTGVVVYIMLYQLYPHTPS